MLIRISAARSFPNKSNLPVHVSELANFFLISEIKTSVLIFKALVILDYGTLVFLKISKKIFAKSRLRFRVRVKVRVSLNKNIQEFSSIKNEKKLNFFIISELHWIVLRFWFFGIFENHVKNMPYKTWTSFDHIFTIQSEHVFRGDLWSLFHVLFKFWISMKKEILVSIFLEICSFCKLFYRFTEL